MFIDILFQDTDETEWMVDTDEMCVFSEANDNDNSNELQTQMFVTSDEMFEMSNTSLNSPSMSISSPAASIQILPPSKKKRLTQIAAAEQENTAINAALQYLTKECSATSNFFFFFKWATITAEAPHPVLYYL